MSMTDAQREAKVVELWSKIFRASNECLRQAIHYGFDAMHEASPNIHEIVRDLTVLKLSSALC